jgi:hypothetical protein
MNRQARLIDTERRLNLLLQTPPALKRLAKAMVKFIRADGRNEYKFMSRLMRKTRNPSRKNSEKLKDSI